MTESFVPQVVDFRSDERAALVQRLAELLGDDGSAAFWSFLQVCKLESIQYLIKGAEVVPDLITSWSESCSVIAKRWAQKYHLPRSQEGSPVDSPRPQKRRRTAVDMSSSPVQAPSPTARDPRYINIAKERDGNACVFTRNPNIEGAHIFPHSMISARSDWAKMCPDIWKILGIFWGHEQMEAWKKDIFRDPANPTRSTDGSFNIISMSPTMHGDWARGVFALRPIKADDNEIIIELNYIPQPNHSFFDRVPLTKAPGTSRREFPVYATTVRPENPQLRVIGHGDVFTIKTNNPATHPLPSFDLLQMQWHLTAIVGLSAAAEAVGIDDFSDDDDDDADEEFPASWGSHEWPLPAPAFEPEPSSQSSQCVSGTQPTSDIQPATKEAETAGEVAQETDTETTA